MLIKITFDRFVEILEERRAVFCPNGIPACVWDYYIDLLRDAVVAIRLKTMTLKSSLTICMLMVIGEITATINLHLKPMKNLS